MRTDDRDIGLTILTEATTELCECQPLSVSNPGQKQQAGQDYVPMTPVTPVLGTYLREELARYFPRTSPISVLLLHISQLEQVHISPSSALLHKRHRFHAPESVLEQVLAYVRRTIRLSDHVVRHAGAGAAIIFPEVDQQGTFSIIERAFHSINLLQPQTVIPPLSHETDIILGIGSYPEPASSFEELLYCASCVAHCLTLRPAVTAHLHPHKAGQPPDTALELITASENSGIPFMHLPAKLPVRLKHLIPYQLARELRCAPVGRDHNRLTVAMAQPADAHALDILKEITGMIIYPVACEAGALDMLLANGW